MDQTDQTKIESTGFVCGGVGKFYCLFIYFAEVAIATDIRKKRIKSTFAQGLILIDSVMDSLSRQRHQSDDVYCSGNAYILKPIHYLIKVPMIIPHRIKPRWY